MKILLLRALGVVFGFVAAVFATLRFVVDWVGRSTVVEDAEQLGPKATKVMTWVADQPGIIFYGLPVLLMALGLILSFRQDQSAVPAAATGAYFGAPRKSEPEPAPVKSTRFRSTAEKEELANRLTAISRLLNKEVSEIIHGWDRLVGGSLNVSMSVDQLKDALVNTSAHMAFTQDVNDRLWQGVVNGDADLAPELRGIVGGDNQKLSFVLAHGHYLRVSIEVAIAITAAEGIHPHARNQYFDLARQNTLSLKMALNELRAWQGETNQRIADKRQQEL